MHKEITEEEVQNIMDNLGNDEILEVVRKVMSIKVSRKINLDMIGKGTGCSQPKRKRKEITLKR